MTTPPKNPGANEATDPLPGLEDLGERKVGPMELAARRTLAALQAEDLLEERHALIAQLILDLAVVVTKATAKGAATAASQAAAQILAAYAVLVPESEGGEPDGYTQLAADLRAAAVDAARRAAEVRDST